MERKLTTNTHAIEAMLSPKWSLGKPVRYYEIC